ncbi:MAG: carboxypeptidase-like regulatory domain-containing protein, partial [archaeon YNP-LCB-003-016]|uniref:carboxypeptidase-like regulatory domain-containing protein n=1 Tax=Candidatus Culexarchaeum yellowstonense TaxID=2928963 RepID=UPI0026F1B796
MSKYIRELQSEYIYGVKYTFTVYPKTISELVDWVREHLGPGEELQLYLCYEVPGVSGWLIFGSATLHSSDGGILEDSVNISGEFWRVGNLTLYLLWYVNQYKNIGTVYVRYPVLRAYITDDRGNRLSGVEVKATLSVSYWDSYYGLTDVNGVAVIDIVNGGEPLNVYARKAGYDSYPDWTYLGQTPAPWVKGGDVEISGVLYYTGVQPPPPTYITVTVRVFHSITKQPIKGATVTLDSTSKVTDENGLTVFTDVQGGRDASIVVKCPGYRDYSTKVSLPLGDVEIGVGLTPIVNVKLELKVDKTT